MKQPIKKLSPRNANTLLKILALKERKIIFGVNKNRFFSVINAGVFIGDINSYGIESEYIYIGKTDFNKLVDFYNREQVIEK